MYIRNWKKEILTIPNALSVFRIGLIPVYLKLYLNAEDARDYAAAAMILAVSCLTDLVDGRIARKFHMISNVGKVLDPLADKLTQLGLLVCLSARRRLLKYLLVIFLLKELWQFGAMIFAMRRGKALNGALRSGKVCTTVLFSGLTLMVLFPGLPDWLVNGVTVICLVFVLYAFGDYILAYVGKEKKIYDME